MVFYNSFIYIETFCVYNTRIYTFDHFLLSAEHWLKLMIENVFSCKCLLTQQPSTRSDKLIESLILKL